MKRHTETRDRAKALRANLSEPERRLWYRLRANRLGVKFQRQVVLAPYIADFASRSERLVIELDGDTHVGRQGYDAARSRVLEERGYRVLRFTNADVMSNLDGVLHAILIALDRDPESPRPLQRERATQRS
jgi:very-short-patch-repair endonuclease